MPKVLLTNHHLINYAGSELVTLDLATEFQHQGWDVTVATFRFGGGIEKFFTEREIPVINVLNQSLPDSEFDLVWSHHFPVLIKCLVEDSVKTKSLVLSSLSPYEPLEAIPFFESQADLILCNSEETKKDIIEYNNCVDFNKNKLFVFNNSVPANWFNLHLDRDDSKLKKIAIISNHPPGEILNAIDILKAQNIEVDLIGISGNPQLVNIDVLNSYNAIITIGRTVQHCMSLGIPVFCYDHFGGPGWLTPDNFQMAEWFNYSGRCCYKRFSGEEIVDNLINGFRENQKHLKFFQTYAGETYSLTKNVEAVFTRISNSHRENADYLSFNSQQLVGKVGKAYRRIFLEREYLQQELERSQSQRQQTQAELEQSQSQGQQTQAELARSQSQGQQTQAELARSQSQIHEIQTELAEIRLQMQHMQAEMQIGLQQALKQVETLQSQLHSTQTELERSQKVITAMESSKFWKIRRFWVLFKKNLGLS